MTTFVSVKNAKDSKHTIIVQRLTAGNYSDKIELGPAYETAIHVWEGTSIVITEGPTVFKEYYNPNNLTGPVFIEPNGSIRELNLKEDI